MIAVILPTIRKEKLDEFGRLWADLFSKYKARVIVVEDGDRPVVNGETVEEVMGEDEDLIYNRTDAVRNLGFIYTLKKYPDVEYLYTLDDDVEPVGDPIGDHLRALNRRVPISWLSTANQYMRGFPYGVRSEAEVVLSHGVWEGIKDWDAPTQLLVNDPAQQVSFYKGPIPKGVYYPMCGMNVMFKKKIAEHMYWSPMGYKAGIDRFADIWCGILSKRELDKKGLAVVSGYSTVYHRRASDPFVNLEKEAKGIRLNEGFWQGDESDEYFIEYKSKAKRWAKLCRSLL